MRPELRILLIDENHQRAESLALALNNSRYKISHLASPNISLLKQVDEIQPDIIVIDIESPSRDILESLSAISHYNPKPVVMFSAEQDTDTINQSIGSGVSAYVVGDVQSDRVKPILDAAVARFREFQKLKTELSDTKQQLAVLADQNDCIAVLGSFTPNENCDSVVCLPYCASDINNDGVVDVNDIMQIISDWGGCQ